MGAPQRVVGRRTRSWKSLLATGIVAAAVASPIPLPLGLGAGPAGATAVTGNLFYTQNCTGPAAANVSRATFTYDTTAQTFSVGGLTAVATTDGADGLLFGPNGNLLVGGQGQRIHEVDPNGGVLSTKTTNNDVFHLSLSRDGTAVYGAGTPGSPTRIPLPLPAGPNAGDTTVSLSGDATTLNSIAFPPSFTGISPNNKAFYTSSPTTGNGQVGVITFTSPTSATTVTRYTLPASHSIVYDPFTDTFVSFGADHVSQIANDLDAPFPTFVSDFALPGTQIDQGSVDGQGHAYAADNNGRLVFIDYAASGLVGFPTFQAAPFLADCLDDVAPLGVSMPPDLSVTKTASPDPVNVGQPLTYTLTASNATGNNDATGVVVTDTLPAGVTYVAATPTQGSCTQSAGTVTCNLGNLDSGDSATITIVVKPTQPGTITNVAAIDGAQPDPNDTNDKAKVTTTVAAAANLSIVKTASPNPVLVGQNLTYGLSVGNAGPSPATGVVVTDTLPAGVTYVSASSTLGSCSQAAGVVTCNLGALAVSGTATITIVVTPNQPGLLTNTAKVKGNEYDQVPGNNSSTTVTTANPAANLSITKSAAPDPVLVGGSLVYTISVKNLGPSPATGVVVTDPLPSNVVYVSSTASQGSCSQASGTVTCNLGTLANGATATVTITVRPTAKNLSTTNKATVKGNQADPVPSNNAGSATTKVLLAEGSAFGVKLNALLVNVGPTPSVYRNTPGTSSAYLANVNAGTLLSAQALTAKTQIGPGATVTSSAETAAVNLVSSLVTARVVKASCAATFTTRSGATTIERITAAGLTLSNITPAPNTTLPLLAGSLVLNEQVVTADGITVNGLHLKVPLLGVDAIVSQAKCVVDP